MKFPLNLEPFRQQAEQALLAGAIRDIEFSGSTYQVLVEDPSTHQESWVFLQLEREGRIKDSFCSADHLDDSSSCIHLAIAYLSLFKGYSDPLHLRFNRSLWNHLCRLFEERLGGNPKKEEKDPFGTFTALSKAGKVIFEIKPLSQDASQFLDKIIHRRLDETEETSLKFSNLSHEELFQWREGKPNPQLRYDLSFWSDLAKWLMKKQEDGVPYTVSFSYSKRGLPNRFLIDFEDVHLLFYISEANLPLVVESLKSVESPLKVIQAGHTEIESISYDKDSHSLYIKEKERNREEKIGADVGFDIRAIPVGGWNFIPGEGFYAAESHELLKCPVLHGLDISHTLSEHGRLISSLLSDYQVHRETTPLSYDLTFDEQWNFHLVAYLFEPGDLSTGDSWLMGNWAFIEEDGFYRIEGNQFHDIETVIEYHQVSEFISQHRSWLNMQEGFQTHIGGIECQLSYEVTPARRLIFSRRLSHIRDGTRQEDFGSWVYVEGFGFYSKGGGSFSFLLRMGASLSPEQIPLFITMNEEELMMIPRFFSAECPVSQAGLKIELVGKNKVVVSPEYELLPKFAHKKLEVFDDFLYLEGEGFHELDGDLSLPGRFCHPIELEGEELSFFLTHEIEALYPYAAKIAPQLIKPKKLSLEANLVEAIPERGRGWYRFRLFYRTEGGLISTTALRLSLKKKVPFAFFEAGLVDTKDERFDWLRQLPKERFEKDSLILNALEFMRLNAFDPIEMIDAKEGGEEWASSVAQLENLSRQHAPEKPDFRGLESHLRSYQEIGVQWLWFLYHQRLSGLLCDDMGLGKTHQTMGLLMSIKNLFKSYAEGVHHPFLIVCPTSVIYHWQDKLHQFVPSLKICSYHGVKRSLEEFNSEHDVLLTTYGVLRNERDILSKIPFEVAIFDEVQIAKNQSSRVYAALTRVKANMKLGLTGTPIENHLRELKSLFDIVLPSYMPGDAEYRKIFVRPIEKEQDQEKKQLLNRLIHPFTLRRKKEEVLKELPEKTEEVAYCDLLPTQQELYTDVLLKRRLALLEELQNEGEPIPYMHIFALLSSLKQICDHPAVYLKQPADYKEYESGKWELFLELLCEARDSNQKVVVFSQYLHMMDIIQEYLKENKIGFASLRGATRDRREQLKFFQEDPSCEVFVGSLHAAGLGIDLTAGSVVIHYDRWWNAARENQATDRIHRIGQTRGVQVFKLVTKGSFEEKIDAMIKRKGKLMEEVVGVDDHQILKTFSRQDLIELLNLVNEESLS